MDAADNACADTLSLARDQVVLGSGTLEATLDAVAAAQPSRPLAMVDASRGDLIIGLAAANASAAGPYASAVLITGADSNLTIGRLCAAILKVGWLHVGNART